MKEFFEVLPLVLRGYKLRFQLFISFIRCSLLRSLLYCIEYSRDSGSNCSYKQNANNGLFHINPNEYADATNPSAGKF